MVLSLAACGGGGTAETGKGSVADAGSQGSLEAGDNESGWGEN